MLCSSERTCVHQSSAYQWKYRCIFWKIEFCIKCEELDLELNVKLFYVQAAILVVFNLASILLVFPAIVSLDLIRREEKKVDVFCCFTG